MYTIMSPSGDPLSPPRGRCWGATEPVFQELLADNRVFFPRDGRGRPRTKRFPYEDEGLVPLTWWPADETGDSDEAKKDLLERFPDHEAFATPKPERLMERIIHIATNPGDLVLDCFAGSGTTAAVAHKMGRRWVTVELSQENVDTFVYPRLAKVIAGEDPGGLTEAVDWKVGGGFLAAAVAPSMFEELDGTVVLAEWATGGELARAVCAQVRYAYALDQPFVGRKGHSRLAVIDGMLTTGVVDFLVGRLEEKETLLIYAQALEPGIEEYVRTARSGSRARKVPRDLARSGPRPSQLVLFDEVPA